MGVALINRMQPPKTIDGARVIEWAWSDDEPFGEVPGADPPEIFGLAITTYDDIQFYRLACDRNWNSTQDAVYDAVVLAKDQLPDQFRKIQAHWQQR